MTRKKSAKTPPLEYAIKVKGSVVTDFLYNCYEDAAAEIKWQEEQDKLFQRTVRRCVVCREGMPWRVCKGNEKKENT